LRDLRAIRTGLLLAAAAVLGIGPAAAHASGPGVTLFTNSSAQPITLSGDQVAVGDVPASTIYTRRANAGDPGTKLRLGGVSVRTLLLENNVDPDAITFVNITRADGGQVTLRRADLADPPPFPEGPALFSDDGSATRFLRPVRGRYATNAKDEVVTTADSGPLQVYVDGGDIPVVASATPLDVKAGETVTFTARVSFRPPGARLSYAWDFGDSTTTSGSATVKHKYDSGGNMQARVSVRGRGGATQQCATFCAGTDAVNVQVGEPPTQPTTTQTTPGGGNGNPQAAGSSTGTGGGGQGGSGGSGAGTGTTPRATTARKPSAARPAKRKPPPPPPKEPFGVTISGVLINDTGEAVRKLPSGAPAGAPKGEQESRGGHTDRTLEIPVGALVAFAVMCLGALRERRGVKLRLA
jgi:hypothetical protein